MSKNDLSIVFLLKTENLFNGFEIGETVVEKTGNFGGRSVDFLGVYAVMRNDIRAAF